MAKEKEKYFDDTFVSKSEKIEIAVCTVHDG